MNSFLLLQMINIQDQELTAGKVGAVWNVIQENPGFKKPRILFTRSFQSDRGTISCIKRPLFCMLYTGKRQKFGKHRLTEPPDLKDWQTLGLVCGWSGWGQRSWPAGRKGDAGHRQAPLSERCHPATSDAGRSVHQNSLVVLLRCGLHPTVWWKRVKIFHYSSFMNSCKLSLFLYKDG